MVKFDRIKLPRKAWRCSWLLTQADAKYSYFARILAKLAPDVIVPQTHGKFSAYWALLEHLGKQTRSLCCRMEKLPGAPGSAIGRISSV